MNHCLHFGEKTSGHCPCPGDCQCHSYLGVCGHMPHDFMHVPNADFCSFCRLGVGAFVHNEHAIRDFKKAEAERLGVSDISPYERLGTSIGKLVTEKQAAYGDAFGKAGRILRELYPTGIPLDKLDDALTITRVVDKLFRIATDKDALGESPWRDIVGYGLLAVKRDEDRKAALTSSK